MLKKMVVWALFLICPHTYSGFAQSYPPEWEVYQSPKYFCSIQSGLNPERMDDNEYFDILTSSAISGLARQLEVRVNETAELDKRSNSGLSSVSYSSKTSYSSDVKLKLVTTQTHYSKRESTWYAIAFIDKSSAISFFKKEIEDKLSTANRLYNNANDLISLGYKERAKNELNEALKSFSITEEAFYWLKVCGLNASEYSALLEIRNNLENLVQQKIALLGHSTTIFIDCSANLFGAQYDMFTSSIKSRLSSDDVSFVSSKSGADWVITITAESKEHNAVTYGTLSSYFSYVDATCKLYKATTGQMVYENSFSEKGGSTNSYIDAAKEAFKQLSSIICNIVGD